MKASILLVSVLATSCLSVPISPLFEPFGDFLQGNVLHSSEAFYSTQDYSALLKQFSVSYKLYFKTSKTFNDQFITKGHLD